MAPEGQLKDRLRFRLRHLVYQFSKDSGNLVKCLDEPSSRPSASNAVLVSPNRSNEHIQVVVQKPARTPTLVLQDRNHIHRSKSPRYAQTVLES